MLWFVAAVPIPIRSVTATAAPARAPASLTLNRSEQEQGAEAELLRSARFVDHVPWAVAVPCQSVAAELVQDLAHPGVSDFFISATSFSVTNSRLVPFPHPA